MKLRKNNDCTRFTRFFFELYFRRGNVLNYPPNAFFIKSKKLPIVEQILDDGKTFYLMNNFTAGVGILHYATVFFWGWHAKHYGLYEKREKVPKKVRCLFVAYYIFFMIVFIAFVLLCFVMHFGFGE